MESGMKKLLIKATSIVCVFVLCATAYGTILHKNVRGGKVDIGDGGPEKNLERSRRISSVITSSFDPVVSSSGKKKLHLAWIEESEKNSYAIRYRRSEDRGLTLSTDILLANQRNPTAHLTVASKPESNVVATAWDSYIDRGEKGGDAIFLRYSIAGGKTWSPLIQVAWGSHPSLTFLGKDRLLVSYATRNESAGNHAFHAVELTLSKKETLEPTVLTSFNISTSEFSTVVTERELHIVWQELYNGNPFLLHVSVELASKESRGPYVVASLEKKIDPGSLRVAVGAGAIHTSWSEKRDGTWGVFLSQTRTDFISWTGSSRLTNSRWNARYPSLAVNSTGSLYLIWQDGRKGNWEIYSREMDRFGKAISPDLRLTYSSWNSMRPSLAIGVDDSAIVLWTDDRDGVSQIYADTNPLFASLDMESVIGYCERLNESFFVPPSSKNKRMFLDASRQVKRTIAWGNERLAIEGVKSLLSKVREEIGVDGPGTIISNESARIHLQVVLSKILKALSDGIDFESEEDHIGTRAAPPDYGFPPGRPGRPPGDEPPDFIEIYGVNHRLINSTVVNITWRTNPHLIESARVTYFKDFDGPFWTEYAEPQDYHRVQLTSLTPNVLYYYYICATKEGYTKRCTLLYSFETSVSISTVRVSSANYTSATIKWRTNINATTLVHYGHNISYSEVAEGANGTEHEVTLTNLTPVTTYHFYVESAAVDFSNSSRKSGDFTFYTGMQMTKPYLLDSTSKPLGFNVTIKWHTSERATTLLRYGTSPENLTYNTTGENGTEHIVYLTDFSSATIYHYEAESSYIGPYNDTQTKTGTPFKTPGIIISDLERLVNTTNATIKWKTNYEGTTLLRYGLNRDCQNNATGVSGFNHSIQIENLTALTTYFLEAISTSLSNDNDTAVRKGFFGTKGIEISNVSVESVWYFGANITWNTNVNGTTLVRYGNVSPLENQVSGENGTFHRVEIVNLSSLTTYKFLVISSAVDNLNSTAASSFTFTTTFAPDDANKSYDAGENMQSAIFVAPGRYDGQLEEGSDLSDFFEFLAQENQIVNVWMEPAAGFDFDLKIYDSYGNEKSNSSTTGSQRENVTVETNTSGFWYIEVLYVDGSSWGVYNFSFNLTGGGVDRFEVDVGSPGDTEIEEHLPGISILSNTGWGNCSTDQVKSKGTWWDIDNFPTYRESSVNSTFLLNLYEKTSQLYTDYLFTIQYYATQDVNISVYNGAGWVYLDTLPGKSNWWAHSFILDHSYFWDFNESAVGLNLALRLSNVSKVDRIYAVSIAYTSYVGNGSDDKDWAYHTPGILLSTGWSNENTPYRNATSGAEIYLNLPDPDISYLVRMRYDGDLTEAWVQQYNGSDWYTISKISNFTTEAYFATSIAQYFDGNLTMPRLNVRIRFISNNLIKNVSLLSMTPAEYFNDVGTEGDGDMEASDPGISLHLNEEWGDRVISGDGRTIRTGQAGANVYLNSPLSGVDYWIKIIYRASSSCSFQQWDGTEWTTLGGIIGDGQWRYGFFRAKSSLYRDWYGIAGINVQFRFTNHLDLDEIMAEPDMDNDNISNFEETYAYYHYDAGKYHNNSRFVFFFEAPGRYQFEIDANVTKGNTYSVDAYVAADGDIIGEWRGGGVNPGEEYQEKLYLNRSFSRGWHDIEIFRAEDATIEVNEILIYKDPTRWDLNDTDGDEVSDWDEPNIWETDPLNTDSDFDGLSDREETWDFYHESTGTHYANYTFNFTVEALSMYRFDIVLNGVIENGECSAMVFLDGITKHQYRSEENFNYGFSFSAMLPRGLHSLQVQRDIGILTMTFLAIWKEYQTYPTDSDSDNDQLLDGEELLGQSGWVTNPRRWDTDNDWSDDGREVMTEKTDPTNPDTDEDGYLDGDDRFPLHDIVVQLYLERICINDPDWMWHKYYAFGGVDLKWTITLNESAQCFYLDHYVSVNVPDDQYFVPVNFSVKSNKPATIDVAPGNDREFTTNFDIRSDIDGYSIGDEDVNAEMSYYIRTVKVSKVNTLLVVPNDYSTIFNGTYGQKRYVGEQRFVFLLLNVTDTSSSAFEKSMNEIIMPRSIFYESMLYQKLNGTYENLLGSPLENATIYGNDFNSSAAFNTHVVQMSVSKNVTASEATELLELAITNESGNVTCTHIQVGDQFYTMGFDYEVYNITPNMAVQNSGNHGVPPPPPDDPTWFEATWNSFTGIVEYAWNGIQSAAVFMCNLVRATVDWTVGLVKAIADGSALEYIQEKIVKPFVDALLEFVEYIVDLIASAAQLVFDYALVPLLGLTSGWCSGIVSELRLIIDTVRHGESGSGLATRLGLALVSGVIPLFALALALTAVSWLIAPVMFVAGLVVAALMATWTMTMLSSLGATQSEEDAELPSAPFAANLIFNLALDIQFSFGDYTEEELNTIASLVFGGFGMLFGIIAASMAVPSTAAIVIGIASFLVVFGTAGAIPELNPGVVPWARALHLALGITGIVTGLIGLGASGAERVFVGLALGFAGLSYTQAYLGEPL